MEKKRLSLQVELDRCKDAAERNRLGQFATPPALALDIARYALRMWQERDEPVRFIDPAVGTGAFYSAAREVFPESLVDQATGIEIDPVFADVASTLWEGTGLTVVTGDFTAQNVPPPDLRYNLMIANPPYVRHHCIATDDKQRLKAALRASLGLNVSGLAGLYCYFLLLSHDWLADNALGIWLIPSEFMDVNYGAAVKRYLSERVCLLHVHRFCPSDVQFTDAIVSSAIVVFRKAPPPPGHSVRFSFGGSLLKPSLERRVSLSRLDVAAKWTQYPDREVRGASDRVPGGTLADLFTVKRGIATGANSFFILSAEDARQRGIPAECLKPILPSPRYLSGDTVEADSLGNPVTERRLFVIDCALPQDEIRLRYPEFWAYLECGRQRGVDAGYLTSRRSPWYSQEKRDPAPFLCTYMGRGNGARDAIRFIGNKSVATAPNVYLLLYPKEPLRSALGSDPELHSRVIGVLKALSLSDILSEGRVYGGGLHKVEPRELGRVPAERLFDLAGKPEIPRQLCMLG